MGSLILLALKASQMKLYRTMPVKSGLHCGSVFFVVFIQFVFLVNQVRVSWHSPVYTPHQTPVQKSPSEKDVLLELLAGSLATKYHEGLAVTSQDPGHKVIVFDCDDPAKCYGLGDRLRGIATLFYLAILTGHSYFLNIPIPYNMENFMVPRLHDWRLNETSQGTTKFLGRSCLRDLEGFPTRGAFEAFGGYPAKVDHAGRELALQAGGKGDENGTSSFDWLISWPQRLWRGDIEGFDPAQEFGTKRLLRFICNVGYPHACVTNPNLRHAAARYGLDQVAPELLFPAALRVLFKPAPCVQVEVDNYISQYQDWYSPDTIKIGVQIRTYVMDGSPVIDGFLTGHIQPPSLDCYEDKLFQIIRDEFRVRSKGMSELDRWSGKERLRDKVIVFVTSDNQQAIDYLNSNLFQFGIRSFSTKQLPSHILESTSVESAAKTYIDWWLLTEMDRLLITKSTFGESAAAYSLRPAEVIDGWVDSCRTWQFNNTFHSDG